MRAESPPHLLEDFGQSLRRAAAFATSLRNRIGLAKADFHVLNVKYGRTEYFRITKALRAAMGLPE